MEQTLGERLIAFRKRNGYSQDELATKLQVSRQSICNWENGTSVPSVDYIKDLAKLYGVSIDDLLNLNKPIEECYIKEANKEQDHSKDKIRITKDGIFIKDDEDDIKINWNDIDGKNVFDKEIKIDGANKDVLLKKRKKALNNNIASIIDSAFLAISIIAYLLLGFLLPKEANPWGIYWVLIIASFIPGGLYRTFTSGLHNFPIVFIAVGIYCYLGCAYGMWHPHWVIMLSIPIFYMFVGLIKKIKKNVRQLKELKDLK